MRPDERGIQIDHHRARIAHRIAMPPHPAPGRRAGATQSRDHRIRIVGEGIDEPADRGIRGHRAEHFRLSAQHRDVGQTIPAQRDRDREVQHHLARIVHRAHRPPGRQSTRKPHDQPAGHRSLQQHRRTRRRDQRLTASLNTNPRTRRDTLHLRSAFPLVEPEPSTSSVSQADRHFRALQGTSRPSITKY